MERAPQRRSSAFAALVREHHAAVYRSALRVVRRAEDAEDAVQQVFARVFERPAALERAEDPRRVLCWMATRAGLELLRGARRRAQHERSYAMERAATTTSVADAHEDEQRAVLEQLDRLPDELRLPLVLRFQEQMTFAAVGEALECSESTAHERVTRGLSQLRRTLAGAGVAVTATQLPAALAATEPVAVPRALEGKLLALEGAGSVASAWGVGHAVAALVAVVAMVGGAGAWWWLDDRDAAESSSPRAFAGAGTGEEIELAEVRSPAVARVPVRSDLPAPERVGPDGQDPGPHGIVTGYVHDQSGAALANVRVVGKSVERRPHSKGARFSRETETRLDGSFRLELPAISAAGQRYTLHFSRRDLGTEIREVTVPADREAAFQTVAMGAAAGRARVVPLVVVDAAGQPLSGVEVELFPARTHPSMIGNSRAPVRAATGDAGRVEPRWNEEGDVLAWVDGRRVGREAVLLRIELGDAPMTDRRVVLAPGRRITGSVRILGGERPRYLSLTARDEATGVWHTAPVAADDTFGFDGLGAGRRTISGSVPGFSLFELRGVRGGTTGLSIKLKPWDDPTDRGDHLAEVHGTIVDADTGEPLVARTWNVAAVRVGPDHAADEVLGDLVCERPVQMEVGFVTEPSPEFHAGGLKAGSWLIVGKMNDFALSWAGPFELAGGRMIRDVQLEMRRGATVSGTVRDPRGRPVSGAVVFVAPPGDLGDAKLRSQDETVAETEGRVTCSLRREVRSGADGSYRLEHIAAGLPLRVVAVHHAWEPVALEPAVLRDGETRSVDVAFRVVR